MINVFKYMFSFPENDILIAISSFNINLIEIMNSSSIWIVSGKLFMFLEYVYKFVVY